MGLDNLNTFEFVFALLSLFVFSFFFYFLMSLFQKVGKYTRIFLWGVGINLMALLVSTVIEKWSVWPLYDSWAIFVVIGYSFADSLFSFVSRHYRKCPGFYLEKIPEVTFPRGGEVIYYGLHHLREKGLGLNPRISTWQEIVAGMGFAFPYAALYSWEAVLAWAAGLLTATFLGIVGFLVDLSAALLRFRCSQS